MMREGKDKRKRETELSNRALLPISHFCPFCQHGRSCDEWEPEHVRRCASRPIGLPNTGNTCFLNSAMQVLLRSSPIREALLLVLRTEGIYADAFLGRVALQMTQVFYATREADPEGEHCARALRAILSVFPRSTTEVNTMQRNSSARSSQGHWKAWAPCAMQPASAPQSASKMQCKALSRLRRRVRCAPTNKELHNR